MENKYLKCVDCDIEFCFSIDEQKFYQDRLLTEPKRCPQCRAVKRLALRERQTEYENRKRVLPSTQSNI